MRERHLQLVQTLLAAKCGLRGRMQPGKFTNQGPLRFKIFFIKLVIRT